METGLREVGRLLGQHAIPPPGDALVLDERFAGQVLEFVIGPFKAV